MKRVKFGKTGENVSAVAVGCMRLIGLEESKRRDFISCALDNGMNFFDHADIYGAGECESVFGKEIKALKIPRDKIFIQSKCGIVPHVGYDFSKEHIIKSVEGILTRLDTDHIDSLLLHRPDTLMHPEEVAEAFDLFKRKGMVIHFGVSNMNPMQIELLKKYVKQDISANQMQFSPVHAGMVASGIEANTLFEGSADRDGHVLEYCRLKDITLQAWSPFQYGLFEGVYLGNEKFAALNKEIEKVAKKYNLTAEGVVCAWILTHPADMQIITGTMNKERLLNIAEGAKVNLNRKEWYDIYLSAGYRLP